MRFKAFFLFFLIVLVEILNPEILGEERIVFEEKAFEVRIPSIFLNAEVCKIEREACLNSGIWMKYSDDRQNFLFTGHSFSLIPFGAGVFYSLDSLKVGDKIYLDYEDVLVYEVYEIFVTNRYDLEVENFEKLENTLVLYSCFPLWSASERIVVRARLCTLCEDEI